MILRANPIRTDLIATLIGTVVGIAIWCAWFGETPSAFLSLGSAGPRGMIALVIAAAIAARLAPVQAMIRAAVQLARQVGSTHRWLMAGIITTLTAIYLTATALGQHRDLWPMMHDEFSYLIGAQQIAHGRLWMPAHPLAAFFDSFQLIVDPVYASAYFPGTALLFSIAVLLHIPPWTIAIATASLTAGVFYLVVTELIDGATALAAVFLLLSCGMFRSLSVMTMAQIPVLLAGLLCTLSWIQWTKTRRKYWIVSVGAAAGFAAITRPVDAICLTAAVGFAIAFYLIKKPREEKPTHGWIKIIGLILLGAAPFLSIQLISNKGITGRWFETPFRLYADRDHPLTSFGFHEFIPGTKPVSDLAQKQDLYTQEYVPQIKEHTLANVFPHWWPQRMRLTCTLSSALPFATLLPLLPIGFLTARGRVWIILAALPLFVALYAAYVFFLPHYPIILAPAVIVGILAGASAVPKIFPARFQPIAAAWLIITLSGITIASLPQWDPTATDQMFDTPLLAVVNDTIQKFPRTHAIVLFRYDPARNVHEEPVYNADVPWPDDAKVIRAHDLGDAKNAELFVYYATHQSQREIYLFDEGTQSITDLGSVSDLTRTQKK